MDQLKLPKPALLAATTITLLFSSIISPTYATDESPSPGAPEWLQAASHDSFTFTSVAFFITPKYDPKATEESVKNNQTIRDLCAMTDDANECLDFLGNTPRSDPAFVIKADLKVLKTLINEGSYIAIREGSKDPSANSDTKKGLDACLDDYDTASKSLDEAMGAIGVCVRDDGTAGPKECPKETVAKLTTVLSAAVGNFGACDKALNIASGRGRLWVMDVNDAMVEASKAILAVANKLDS
ncbi:unnamed protein product [Linum trigynum]|uniref:Pectinesterase inhibitor domain-containing protein n=1 Tax=Linum trigynum TaxID=586398 RepID=A0AAV2DWK0_9ROSI